MRKTRQARRIPRVAIAAAVTALLAVVAGCGGAGGVATHATTLKKYTATKELVAAAKKEGDVVWYTTLTEKEVPKVVGEFEKRYPGIKVHTLRLTAQDLLGRVATEQRGQKYNVDVVTGEAAYVNQMRIAGYLQPYQPPDAATPPVGVKLPKGYQGIFYAETTVIAYNPTALKAHGIAPPRSWQDLTDPRWKGKFSVDPEAVNWYESLIAEMGHAKALALVKRLGDNSPRLVESHTQALTQVQSGEPYATATAYGYLAAKLHKSTPDTVAFVNASPLPSSLTLLDVARSAPHPAAAELLADWLVSKDGQRAVVKATNHTSLREDIGGDKSVYDPSRWKPVFASPTLDTGQANAYLNEFGKALHKP